MTNLDGCDAFSRLKSKTPAQQIQGVRTSSRKQIAQWSFRKLSDRHIIRQFCMTLRRKKKHYINFELKHVKKGFF